jgi:hypothetical protein
VKENPGWTWNFATSAVRSPGSVLRKHKMPWRWEMLDPWLEQIALARQALRQALVDDPAKAEAWEILFGPEADPKTMSEGLAHVAYLLHCVWRDLADHIDKISRPPGTSDYHWELMLRVIHHGRGMEEEEQP